MQTYEGPLVVVFVKNRKRTLKVLKIGLMSFVKMLPMVLIIIIGIGFFWVLFRQAPSRTLREMNQVL